MQPEAQILREPARYRIVVAGQLECSYFSSRYHPVEWVVTDANTAVTLVLADQTALFALLRRVRDLGLPLLLVERLPLEEQK